MLDQTHIAILEPMICDLLYQNQAYGLFSNIKK